MKLSAFCAALLALCWAAAAHSQSSRPLVSAQESIFSNHGSASYASVKNAALAQSRASPFYKSNGVETRVYEGYFRAASNQTRVALLSDDGTSVWIDGQPVISRAGQGQGFENFDTTFTPLAYSFVAGQVYHFKLVYTNTIHLGNADVDGLSLWAYNGGGEIVNLNLSISASASSLCAGGLGKDIHQTEITATLTSDGSIPVAGKIVSFTLSNSNETYPFVLSATSATTDGQGKARVTLKSSRKINATCTVSAQALQTRATSGTITANKPLANLSIAPQVLIADGESRANLKAQLTFGSGFAPVRGHSYSWIIDRVWNGNEQLVYDSESSFGSLSGYGSIASHATTTTAVGDANAVYTVGTEPGIIEFALLDNTIVENSPAKWRLRTTAKKWSVKQITVSGTQQIHNVGNVIYAANYNATGGLVKVVQHKPIAHPKNRSFYESFELMPFPSGGVWGVDTAGLKWQAKWKITANGTIKNQGKQNGTGDSGTLKVHTQNTVGLYTLTHNFSIAQSSNNLKWSGSLTEDSVLYTTYQAPFLCSPANFNVEHLRKVTAMAQGANGLNKMHSNSIPRLLQKAMGSPYLIGTLYGEAQHWNMLMGKPNWYVDDRGVGKMAIGGDCDDWAQTHRQAMALLGIPSRLVFVQGDKISASKVKGFIMKPDTSGPGWNYHAVSQVMAAGQYCYSLTQSTQPVGTLDEMRDGTGAGKVIYKQTSDVWDVMLPYSSDVIVVHP